MLCELTERKGEEMVSVLVVSKKFKLKIALKNIQCMCMGLSKILILMHRKPCNG